MCKRISSFALSVCLFLGLWVQQAAALEGPSILEDGAEAETAAWEGPSIFVGGAEVEAAAAFLYQNTMYGSLYNLTLALRPDAVISWEGDHAVVTAEGLYLTACPGSRYLQVNGRYLYLPYGIWIENGDTVVPVRALAQALNAPLWWEPSDGNVYMGSSEGAIVSGDEYYDEDALYWLSHIIFTESGNQPLEGKIAVGNVILNRVNSPVFPNTIYNVIFQANQFAPAQSGSIYREPNAESILAAKLCLDGAVVLPTALWFNRAGVSCWASKNKTCVATIGSQSFYA